LRPAGVRRRNGFDEQAAEVEHVDVVRTQGVGEGVVFFLCAIDPRDVVEEQVVAVARREPFELHPRSMKHHRPQPTDLGLDAVSSLAVRRRHLSRVSARRYRPSSSTSSGRGGVTTVRVMLTGATGFIGGEVARQLRARGDEVVALVRSPDKAKPLSDLGVELVEGDLSNDSAIVRAIEGADAVIHAAAIYEVGILPRERPAMYVANVEGTRRVLTAALDAGVKRAVYVSTVGIFGDTHGAIVDETYRHPRDSYTSYYEETKLLAHDIALELIERGLPLVIVQPGGVYGPGDPSTLGDSINRVARGRLPVLPFGELGMTMVHRDDVADGILRALDVGRVGESYILAGEPVRMRDLLQRTARAAGKRGPIAPLPTGMIRASAPLGRVLGPVMGLPKNFRELISTSHRVTFWAKADKARAELGFDPRPLDDGLAELVGADRSSRT
jgi:dihydroflavonol-4-reductase